MNRYYVSIPITGTCTFEVDAESEDGAIEAAWQAVDDGADGDVTWEYCEQIVEGNCFHGMQNEIEVQMLRPNTARGKDEGNAP